MYSFGHINLVDPDEVGNCRGPEGPRIICEY